MKTLMDAANRFAIPQNEAIGKSNYVAGGRWMAHKIKYIMTLVLSNYTSGCYDNDKNVFASAVCDSLCKEIDKLLL